MRRLTETELERYRRELARLAENDAAEWEETDPSCRRFAPDSPRGCQIYESYSDEELLDLLRGIARRLGRSPAQHEVFCVYRCYLRARFKNWPTALRRAGLSRAAGKCGKSLAQMERETRDFNALLAQVREKAVELGRMPHPTDLPEVCRALNKRFQNWGEVLSAAGVEQIETQPVSLLEDLEPEYRALLEDLHARAVELNRAPLRKEVDASARGALVRRCGSWRNTLYQIGLEPVRRISPFANVSLTPLDGSTHARHRATLYDCYYRVLTLDERSLAELELVRDTARCLGRAPGRRDIPPEVRRHLQDVCGSWSNALYQIGLQPKCRGIGAGDSSAPEHGIR